VKQFGSLLAAVLVLTFAPRCFSQQPEPEAVELRLKESAERLLAELINEAKDSRLPVPDAAEVSDACKFIQEAFTEKYRSAKDLRWLMDEHFLAHREEKDPIRGYALLIEARELASDNNAFELATKAIDAIAARYQQDATQMRTEYLAKAVKSHKDSAGSERMARLFDLAIETARQGTGRNSFAAAKAAVSLAEEISQAMCANAKTRKAEIEQQVADAEQELANSESKLGKKKQEEKNRELCRVAHKLEWDANNCQEQARNLAEAIGRREKLFRDYSSALQSLQLNSDDLPANAVVGQYLCLELGDWRRGLPFMALGNREGLALVARHELTVLDGKDEIDPAACGPQAVLALANDLWKTAGDIRNGKPLGSGDQIHADAMKRHAASLYGRLSSLLTNRLDQGVAINRAKFTDGAAEAEWFRPVGPPSLCLGNLLEDCEPRRHALTGVWQRVPDGVLSNNAEPAKMKLTFQGKLPEQYDFEIEFTPQSGGLCVSQLLSAYGAGFACDFGGWWNKVVAFQLVDGRTGDNNRSTTRRPEWLTAGRRHIAVVKVRRNSVAAFLNGQHVVTLPTDYRNLRYRDDWAIPVDSLGIGSWGTPTVFHRASVIPR
jgi:hypothetical protein